MKKFLGLALAFGLATSAMAYTAPTATRVGPVSQYGKLLAGSYSANGHKNGRIYGACEGIEKGKEVQVRGMSLYWSLHGDATEFYNETAISKMVSDMKIEIIRIPVGTSEPEWSEGNGGGYINNPSGQKKYVKAVVDAAVKNDIYVIIDWHSHTANDQKENAKGFFQYMASEYGSLPNVIFEVFNEPTSQSWSTIKSYAEDVIAEIRNYSTNLIIVGNRSFDQYPNEAVDNPINDDNVAYSFHYYANSHSWGQDVSTEGGRAVIAMENGLSVFVSEWGTANYDGQGTPDASRNQQWQDWMDTYKLSAANWSASRINEGTAGFTTGSSRYSISYTTSGSMVKGYLAKNPSSYTACTASSNSSTSTTPTSSASVTAGSLIDDFEDGNGHAYTGLEDFWYAFTDAGDNGASTFTNEKDDDGNAVVVTKTAAYEGNYGVGLTGIKLAKGNNANDPYVALGLDIAGGLKGCKTITYDYKGASHSLKAIMSGDTKTITITKNGSQQTVSALTYWDRHYASVTGGTTWQQAEIPVNDLKQAGWGNDATLKIDDVVSLQWEVKKTASPAYLYIDNLRCEGMSIVPVVDPEEESSSSVKQTTSSSSVKTTSSSSVAPASSATVPASSATVVNNGLIDDFEDGNTTSEFGEYEFYWYIYTSNAEVSNISGKDDEGNTVWDMVKSASSNSYVAMTGIKGITSGSTKYPSVGMGFDVTSGAFGQCIAIQYDYKGSGHQFRAAVEGVTLDKGYEHITSENPTFSATTTWKTVTVTASDLKQPSWIPTTEVKSFSWDKVVKVAWVVSEKLKTADIGTELDIDNVVCVMDETPVASSTSVNPGSSTSVNPGSSTSVNPNTSASTGTQGIIDDFEDGDSQNNLGQYWYVYADEQGSSFGNAKNEYKGYNVYFDADNSSTGMVGVVGVSMGSKIGDVDPTINLETPLNYNMTNCTEITYDYKGASHNFKVAMIGDEEGEMTGYNQHKVAVPGSAIWTSASISWSDLDQELYWGTKVSLNKSKIAKFGWEIKGETIDYDYLYVDNVRCVGLTVSEASVIKSSSSSAQRPINGYSSSSAGYVPSYQGLVANAAQQGLKVGVHGSEVTISVAKSGLVKVAVFDMMGHVIESHVENMTAGSYAHSLAKLSQGTYVVRVQQGSAVKSIRMQVR